MPSAGALDQEDRYNLVVFAEDRSRVVRMIAGLREVGELIIGAARSEHG